MRASVNRNAEARRMTSERGTGPGEPPADERAETGSLNRIWDLLMQVGVFLPYLSRIMPLLDRVKTSSDLSTVVRKGMQAVESGSRDLSAHVQSQGLQLAQIEEQTQRLREMAERGSSEVREISGQVQALRTWILALAGLNAVLLVAVVVLVVLQLWHFGR